MSLITEAEASKLLEPHHSSFFEALDVAWGVWTAKMLPEAPLFNPHTQASFIHDVAERELRTRLGGAPGVVMSQPKSERFWVHFAGQDILVRVKKLTSRGVANYPTDTALAFNGQRKLPGLPSGPRITLGYRLTPANDRMLGVYVALLKGNRTMWQYQLLRSSTGAVSVLTPPPELPNVGVELQLKSDAKTSRNAK